MTLIVNEIYYDPISPANSRIISAADRRITAQGAAVEKRKLFHLEELNATISYFGIASIASGRIVESLLQEFIASAEAKAATSIRQFAERLRTYLNKAVDRALLRQYWSGFHVCGFNDKGVPEMWYITNIGGMTGLSYTNLSDEYGPPTEELSTVHLKDLFDRASGVYTNSFRFSFQNGDLRTFHLAWSLLDGFSGVMDSIGLSRPPRFPFEFEARLKWKMLTIGLFYENVSYDRLVGSNIDVVTLLPNL